MGVVLLAVGHAQEIPRPSISRSKAATLGSQRPYNLKLGPVALTANAAFGLEFVDNVNLTSVEKSGDFILHPSLGIVGGWQVTKLNNLELRTTIGYTKYLEHPDLDSQTALISPDSVLRLNVYVGDLKIEFHEFFSLEEDPVTQGSVSGVAKLGRFTNTIGVSVLWDLNDVIWLLGYDHYNFIATGSTANTNGSTNNNLSAYDHSTDQISSAGAVKLSPTTQLGLEVTAAYSAYPQNSRADSSQLTLGPFLDVQLTRYTHLTFGGGYNLYNSESNGEATAPPESLSTPGISGVSSIAVRTQGGAANSQGGDGSGYYLNLSVTHRLNRFYQDRLAVGHEYDVGLLAERTESSFVNYTSQWTFSRRLGLSTALFFEDVHQTAQFTNSFGVASVSDYQRCGAIFSSSVQVTKKLSASVSYQFTKKITDVVGQDYTQNRVALQFGYQF